MISFIISESDMEGYQKLWPSVHNREHFTPIINSQYRNSLGLHWATKINFRSATEENSSVLDKVEHCDSEFQIKIYPARQNFKL